MNLCTGDGDKLQAQVSPMSHASTHVPEIFPEDCVEEIPDRVEALEESDGSDFHGTDKETLGKRAHDARKHLLQEMFAEARHVYQNAEAKAHDGEDLLANILAEVKTIYFDMYGRTADMEQEFSDYVQQVGLEQIRGATYCELPGQSKTNHHLGLAAQARQEMLEALLEEVKYLSMQSSLTNKYPHKELSQEMLQDATDMYFEMYGRTDATLGEVSKHVEWFRASGYGKHADESED